MNWVDIIIMTIIIASIIKGYSDGFMLSVFSIIGFIVAIVAAKLYFRGLSHYLATSTPLYNKLYLTVLKSIKSTDSIFQEESLNGLHLPKAFENIELYTEAIQVNPGPIAENIAGTLSTIIINILSILAIYFAVRIIFAVLISILNALVELPILKQFNKIGGIAVGILKGILGAMILFALTIPLTTIFPMEWLARAIDRSVIAGYFYRYNFIIPWALELVSKTLSI